MEVRVMTKDQIALVMPDLSNFMAIISVILGTPTINCIINVMKEVEIDALAMSWVNARVAHLLSVCRMTAVKVGDGIAEESGLQWLWPGNVHPKCRDYRGLFLPCGASESGKGLHWRTYKHHGTSLMDWRWLFATRPHHTKHVHRAEARK